MRFITTHAKKRILERGMSCEIIADVIQYGVRKIELTRNSVKHILKRGNDKFVVVVSFDGVVITAYKKNRSGGRKVF